MNSHLVKCAIFNAVSDLKALKAEHEINVSKLGKAVEHITGQRQYGLIAGLVNGSIGQNWERKEYGRKLGKGLLTQYVKLHGLTL